MIALEQLVPANHLVRKLEASIDFSFIYPLVQDMYSSERGRPSIDPVILIKMAFILCAKRNKWYKADQKGTPTSMSFTNCSVIKSMLFAIKRIGK